MFNPSLTKRIEHKVKEKTRIISAPYLRSKLDRLDFSIISNNCWGGVVYESYGLKKLSPTVGCYFFAEDYLRFIQELDKYLSLEIQIITASQAKHKEEIFEHGSEDCPIGVLDDIEVVFQHYKTAELAKTKWMNRVERVCWDNLIFKFSYMNSCTKDHLKKFDDMELPGKKIMFVNEKEHGYKCGVYYHGFESEKQIDNDTFYFDKYFDITRFINGKGIIQK